MPQKHLGHSGVQLSLAVRVDCSSSDCYFAVLSYLLSPVGLLLTASVDSQGVRCTKGSNAVHYIAICFKSAVR